MICCSFHSMNENGKKERKKKDSFIHFISPFVCSFVNYFHIDTFESHHNNIVAKYREKKCKSFAIKCFSYTTHIYIVLLFIIIDCNSRANHIHFFFFHFFFLILYRSIGPVDHNLTMYSAFH